MLPSERIGGYRVVRKLATGTMTDVVLASAEGPHGFSRTVVLKMTRSARMAGRSVGVQ